MSAAPKLTLEERIALKHKPGRKPVHLVAAMPLPQGREAMWAAVRNLAAKGDFSLLDIERITRINIKTITCFVQGLANGGYVERGPQHRDAETGGFQPRRYRLVTDCGVEPPRVNRKGKPVLQGTAGEAMWQAMRILRSFTPDELMHAASGGQRIGRDHARGYVKNLYHARYLRLVEKSTPGRQARYALIPACNTGPLPPQVQRVKQVFDPNLGKVVWPVTEGAQ